MSANVTESGSSSRWPDDRPFAFTIFDDTDFVTTDSVKEVYALLEDLGFRTTKSVWPIKGDDEPRVGGTTCEDPGYLDWVLGLQARGFEIGLHNVTYHSSERADTLRGINRFRELFGHDPHTMANHTGCDESMYWGGARLTGVHAALYHLLMRFRSYNRYQGHIQESSLFWGDLCRERVRYVRNFVFNDINTLGACPYMPYHDPRRPYVANWFASSEAPEVDTFCEMIDESSQDRLAAEGGACIMYTHLACGFQENGRLRPRFRSLMERLAGLGGWYVPTAELLDYLNRVRGRHTLTNSERRTLERRWLYHKLRIGGTS